LNIQQQSSNKQLYTLQREGRAHCRVNEKKNKQREEECIIIDEETIICTVDDEDIVEEIIGKKR